MFISISLLVHWFISLDLIWRELLNVSAEAWQCIPIVDLCLGIEDLCLGIMDLCLGIVDLCLGIVNLCLGIGIPCLGIGILCLGIGVSGGGIGGNVIRMMIRRGCNLVDVLVMLMIVWIIDYLTGIGWVMLGVWCVLVFEFCF